MKKYLLVLALAAFFAAGTAFADYPDGLGIGVQFGFGGAWDDEYYGDPGGNVALSLKIPSLPVFWTVNMALNKDWWDFYLGVSGDYYFIHQALVPEINLDWYLGVGAVIEVGKTKEYKVLGKTYGGDLWLGTAARLPVGLSIQPLDLLEIYFEVAPSIGAWIFDEFEFPFGGWSGALGVRFWL